MRTISRVFVEAVLILLPGLMMVTFTAWFAASFAAIGMLAVGAMGLAGMAVGNPECLCAGLLLGLFGFNRGLEAAGWVTDALRRRLLRESGERV